MKGACGKDTVIVPLAMGWTTEDYESTPSRGRRCLSCPKYLGQLYGTHNLSFNGELKALD
jgi:hypothetical protein